MKNFLTLITVAFMLIIGNANAEMRYGVSVAYTTVDADGSETEGGEKTKKYLKNE